MGKKLQYVDVVLMPAVSEEQQPFKSSSLEEALKLQGGQDCSSCVFCAKTLQCGDIQTLEGNERVEHRPKKHSTVVVIVKLSLHYP